MVVIQYNNVHGAEEQAFRGDDPNQSNLQGGSQDGQGPRSELWQGDGGWGMNSMARPDSNDFTLAAELLGLPAVSQGFSAKARTSKLALAAWFLLSPCSVGFAL